MKIFFFVNKNINSATARFRGFFFSNYIKSKIPSKVIRIDEIYNRYFFNLSRLKKFIQYIVFFKDLKKNEIIYLVKTVYNIDFLIAILVAKFFYRIKIIFDFDDAIYLKPFTKRSTRVLVTIADLVMVGSSTLLNWSKKHNDNSYKLPTSIPHNIYKKLPKKKERVFTIGWIGNGNNHYKNLILLKPVFEDLIKKKVSFKFRVIGVANNLEILKLFRSIKGLNFEFKNQIKWKDPNVVVKEIKKFDVGVMPLVKDQKTLGKCAFKIIEYMGSGTPVIASSVGENRIVINNKLDGILCNNTKDWVKNIILLKSNKKIKMKLVDNALIKVEKFYSLKSNAQKLDKALIQLNVI